MTRSWHELARPEQLPPDGNWRIFLVERGRGWGKTRAATEWLAEQAATRPGIRCAFVGLSWREITRWHIPDLLQALDLGEARSSNLINGIIRLTNGSTIEGFAYDRLDRMIGPFDAAVAHEINSWEQQERGIWDSLEKEVAPSGRIFAVATPRENLSQRLAAQLTTRQLPLQVWRLG